MKTQKVANIQAFIIIMTIYIIFIRLDLN